MIPIAATSGKWPVDSFFDRPSTAQPHVQGVTGASRFIGPVAERLRLAVTGEHERDAGVSVLLGRRGPAAVFRGVIAIVINSVNGVSLGGFRPHVGIKRAEVIKPSVADLDSTPTIVGVFLAARVAASVLNRSPRVVARSVAEAVFNNVIRCICHTRNYIGSVQWQQ